MNPYFASLIIAIPLSALGVLYMKFGGKKLVEMLKNGSEDNNLSDQQWTYLFLGAFALTPFVLGIAASAVFGLITNVGYYQALVLGLGVLFSILAWVSKTPLPLEKTVMNLLVAIGFGLILPLVVV